MEGSSPQTSEGLTQLSMTLMLQHMVLRGPCGSTGNGHLHRPQMQQDNEPNMAISSGLGSDVTMDPGGSAGLSDWHGYSREWSPDSNMVPGGSPDS